ncbi:50S ribosomal protein L4 [Verrucomicrobiales bacterium]|nr:50S ribosomal protein L4 [Verrucomicrobiales bacterium]MDB4657378.1 50S ribosomal protein L4 [Verrucomicrobiales bacterium]MDC0291828.1 50S ribosomal protein L4 [Verrucomicrobiales bacterium]
MAATALTTEAAKSANIGIIEESYRGRQAVHDVVVAMRSNRRSGTAHVKTRAEVSGTGKKPFRQKGTGRARQGGNRPPIHVGGGVAFGPRNTRNYKKDVTKSTRRLAFSKALSERISDGDVLTISSFAVSDGKTKSFAKEVGGLVDDVKKVLIVSSSFDEETKRAGRNFQSVLLMSAAEVNTEQILHHNTIILVEDAMETLASRTVEN